jgi:ribosomal-protein-alanine N-acetyltransferase
MFNLFKITSKPIKLEGQRIYLRTPLMEDYLEWRRLRQGSKSFLQTWEPLWSIYEFERNTFKHRIKAYNKQIRQSNAYPFFIFKKDSNTLIGGINLTDVKRRSSQSANLGYWMGVPFNNQGFMSEAVNTVVNYAFHGLNLHRIQASCIPHNAASIQVLRKNHFVEEGLGRSYLKINGSWQDHLLFARINEL